MEKCNSEKGEIGEHSKRSNQLTDEIEDKLMTARQSIVDRTKLFEIPMAHSKAAEASR
jgi:hypothetical protein